MIKRFAFSLIFILPMMLPAQGIEFFDGTWAEALVLAEKEQKIIFIDCYTTWCGPCKKMSANTFTDQTVGDFHSKNFISMKLDMEKPAGRDFGSKYQVSAYPTLFYIDEKGEVVQKTTGYRVPEQLITVGKQALSKVDRTGDLKIAYDEGDRDYDLIFKYVTELNKMGKPSMKISNDYLNSKPKITEKQREDFLFTAVVDSDSKIFEELLTVKSNIEKRMGKDLVEEKIKAACNATVKKAVEFEYPDLVDGAIKSYKSAYSKKAGEYELEAKRVYALSSYNYDEWAGLNEKYFKKYAKKDKEAYKTAINDMKKYFPKHPKGSKVLEKYFQSLIELDDNSNNYFNYIRLLIENRNLSEGLKVTKEAINNAKSKGEDTKKLESMLKFIETM